MEGGGAAVDVVVGLLAARESEVTEAKGEGCDQIEKVGTVVRHGVYSPGMLNGQSIDYKQLT
jgi:hypothetical protein